MQKKMHHIARFSFMLTGFFWHLVWILPNSFHRAYFSFTFFLFISGISSSRLLFSWLLCDKPNLKINYFQSLNLVDSWIAKEVYFGILSLIYFFKFSSLFYCKKITFSQINELVYCRSVEDMRLLILNLWLMANWQKQ